MCPSISCIHFASYVDFPHRPLRHFLRFYCFNTGTSPASTTSCMHLVSVSKSPPCARSKKSVRVPKKKAPRSKNIQPNVSAYNNGVPLATLWRQGPRSRCTGPKNRNRAQKQLICLSKKKSRGQAQIHAGPKKYPHRVQKTHKQVPNIFCDPRFKKKSGQVQKTPTGPKKGCPGPKNMHPIYIYIYILNSGGYMSIDYHWFLYIILTFLYLSRGWMGGCPIFFMRSAEVLVRLAASATTGSARPASAAGHGVALGIPCDLRQIDRDSSQ